MELFKQQVQDSLNVIVQNNDDDKCIAGFDILVKLIQNIIKDPINDKFRKLKKSNKAVSQKLLILVPQEMVIALIEILGYVKDEEDDDVYTFEGEYYNGIIIAEK